MIGVYTYKLGAIDPVVVRFWEAISDHRVITFSGDMGAGKTTFISHLCRYLQVEDAVSSPTFALINEYGFTKDGRHETIFHLDWYRLRDTEEAVNAGMEECVTTALQGRAWCFIEWPEKAPELLHVPHAAVRIETIGIDERRMTVTTS